MVTLHPGIPQHLHLLLFKKSHGGTEIQIRFLTQLAEDLTELLQVLLRDRASACDERKPAYTRRGISLRCLKHVVRIKEIIRDAPRVMTRCLSTPFAVLPTSSATRTHDRAGIHLPTLPASAYLAGGITQFIKVGVYGKPVSLLSGDSFATQSFFFQKKKIFFVCHNFSIRCIRHAP